MSPLTQMLVSIFGLRPVMLAGTILIAISLELAGFSTEVYFFLLKMITIKIKKGEIIIY
jgi:hypothetical protein